MGLPTQGQSVLYGDTPMEQFSLARLHKSMSLKMVKEIAQRGINIKGIQNDDWFVVKIQEAPHPDFEELL